MANNDLKNDVYIQRWLKGLSERTKENYLNRIPPWTSFVKMTPAQQIEND
jgi:hypothetical protein